MRLRLHIRSFVATRYLAAFLLLSSLGVPGPVSALEPQPSARLDRAAAVRQVEKWDRILGGADDALGQGDAKKARKLSNRILSDCLDWALSGEVVERRLAMAFVLRAIAQHKLGDLEDARWSWQSALILFPAASEWDLSGYGSSADAFAEIEPARGWDLSDAIWPRETPKGLRAPLKKRGTVARITPSRVYRREGELKLQYVVTVEGRTRGPKVVSNTLPSTYLAAMLEAYGEWRYKPGMFEGKVVEMLAMQKVEVKW